MHMAFIRNLTPPLFFFFSRPGKGCGINVSTPAPVTALDLLCRPGEHLDAETVLALVLTEFERLWTEFVAGRGNWAPFEEAYLDMWMHSYVFRSTLCLFTFHASDGHPGFIQNVVTNS
jgi:hypothetical protein